MTSRWRAIAERIESETDGQPIDQDWLRRMTGLLAKLKQLKWRYTDGTSRAAVARRWV